MKTSNAFRRQKKLNPEGRKRKKDKEVNKGRVQTWQKPRRLGSRYKTRKLSRSAPDRRNKLGQLLDGSVEDRRGKNRRQKTWQNEEVQNLRKNKEEISFLKNSILKAHLCSLW